MGSPMTRRDERRLDRRRQYRSMGWKCNTERGKRCSGDACHRCVYFSPVAETGTTDTTSRPALASASSREMTLCAPLQRPQRRLIIFHVSMARMYSTTQPKLTPHSHPIAPCLKTFSLMMGMYTMGNIITRPAMTAKKRKRLRHSVGKTERPCGADEGVLGYMLNSERAKCLTSHAVTRRSSVMVVYVVARARNTTSQVELYDSLQPEPRLPPPGPT